jgi:hypothetical protein
MSEENKALARRFLEEAFNEGNFGVVRQLVSITTASSFP